MQGNYTVTPHIIERWAIADKVEMAGVPQPETGENALLLFTNADAAERFRADTGRFPTSEGFEVVSTDLEGLRNIIHTWGYRSVAVCGFEPGGGAAVVGAEDFCALLEEAE